MGKKWFIVIAVLLVAFLIMQVFQPEKNTSKSASQDEIMFQVTIPASVKKKLVNACYDCHSDNTRYPFYSRVAPVSWMIGNHIREGKEKLNFSAWASYDKRRQLKLLTEICDVVTLGEMPLKGYVFMHSLALFNEKETEDLCSWTEAAAEEVMSK